MVPVARRETTVAGVQARVADVTDVASLREVLRGADAVLCALGPRLPGLAPS